MLKSNGSVLCEVYVANLRDGYLLLTEGGPPQEILAVLKDEAKKYGGDMTVTDRTREAGLIGLDGPFAWEVLKDLVGAGILGTRYLGILEGESIGNMPVTIFRAGKTGEFGYLLWVQGGNTQQVWDKLLEAGKEYDITPCGMAAIDLCKLENRVVNVNREGRRAQNVLELNCRYMVDRDKDDYTGSEAVKAALATGPDRRLIGVTLEWPGAGSGPEPALSSEIQHEGQAIGILANTAYSPTLGKQIGLVFLKAPFAYVGLDYTLNASDKNCSVRTVSCPFIMNRSISIRPQEDSYKASHS
jgi:aminomethyltransferase